MQISSLTHATFTAIDVCEAHLWLMGGPDTCQPAGPLSHMVRLHTSYHGETQTLTHYLSLATRPHGRLAAILEILLQ